MVILLDTSVEPGGDLVAPLVAALEDPTVAVAGPFGIVSDDLRQFRDADDDVTDVDAIQGYALAFRRSDYVDRGPLDEHFAFYRNLDIWWSLVLRDQPEDAADDAAPRRAVRVAGDPDHAPRPPRLDGALRRRARAAVEEELLPRSSSASRPAATCSSARRQD